MQWRDTVPSGHVQTASEHVQKLSFVIVYLYVANQILLCQTWAAVGEAVNRDDIQKRLRLLGMSQNKGSCLTTLLVTHRESG